MKKNALFILSFILIAISACNDDDSTTAETTAVAFVNQTVNVIAAENTVNVVFSAPTTAAGTVVINVLTTDLVYGTDFTTNPAIINNTITLPFEANATSATFSFTKLIDAIEGQVKNVKFTIASVSFEGIEVPEATNFIQLNFNETAIVANALSPENGGNKIPNQVYIDLSSGATTNVPRTSWDFGFYSGSDFRVVSNGAINKFAVKQLNTTNIDEVQTADPSVTTGNFDVANLAYVDAPYGNLSGTAIAEIAANEADNKVYLVNLGDKVATVAPGTATGVALTGDARGWKKIRILRSGNDYKFQYANIDATTHSEIIISKNAAFNFSFFSFDVNTVVQAEPQKEKWDLNITTFTNEVFQGPTPMGAYFYPDFAVTNTKAGTRAYQVFTSDFTYENFNLTNVVLDNLLTDLAKDQRAIGSNWRATVPLALKTDRFYVIKDVAGNIYKLKFTAMQNAEGERGHVSFEYKLLQ
ncbi:MAG: HmuY family protein [Flavobacterium sp.]|nr:HmuY family protein [Flavobacterium sp.]